MCMFRRGMGPRWVKQTKMVREEGRCCCTGWSAHSTARRSCLLHIPAVLLMQSYRKTHSQSHNASYYDKRDETYSLPSPPTSDIGVVPQILEFFSLRTRDIPHAISWWLLSIPISWRLSQKPSAEGAMMWLLNGRRWWRIAIFIYDGQPVVKGAGTRASSTSPSPMRRMAR